MATRKKRVRVRLLRRQAACPLMYGVSLHVDQLSRTCAREVMLTGARHGAAMASGRETLHPSALRDGQRPSTIDATSGPRHVRPDYEAATAPRESRRPNIGNTDV